MGNNYQAFMRALSLIFLMPGFAYAGSFDEFRAIDWNLTRAMITSRYPQVAVGKCSALTASTFSDNGIECESLYIPDDKYDISGIPFRITFRFFEKSGLLESVSFHALEHVPPGEIGKKSSVSICTRIESMLSKLYGLGQTEGIIDNEASYLKIVRWKQDSIAVNSRCKYPTYNQVSLHVSFRSAASSDK
ncbi:hypothetical protein [Massilia sp. CT11-137]|uniref:hypothetical protein n=1 Tax=Massilia sp. CT11-137 TaxID=3393901 RepID=UPI0039AFAB99